MWQRVWVHFRIRQSLLPKKEAPSPSGGGEGDTSETPSFSAENVELWSCPLPVLTTDWVDVIAECVFFRAFCEGNRTNDLVMFFFGGNGFSWLSAMSYGGQLIKAGLNIGSGSSQFFQSGNGGVREENTGPLLQAALKENWQGCWSAWKWIALEL